MKKLLLHFLFFIAIASFGQATMITDINLGNKSSAPNHKIKFKDYVYFVANDGVHGKELWRTDGTEAGTTLFKDFIPGEESGISTFFSFATDTYLYFTAKENTDLYLWKTDGTEAGTEKLKQFSSFQEMHAVINETLIFSANNQLWKTDGTETGTEFVSLVPVFGNRFIKLGEELIYAGRQNSFQGTELWKTDGTTQGTTLIKDIYTGSNRSSFPNNFAVLNGAAYFSADNGSVGNELWKTDGTAAGTTLVKDITPGASSTFSTDSPLVVFNSEIFFQKGNSLWKTDGTDAGTAELVDLQSNIKRIITFNSKLYVFNRNNSFWVSDGTILGTNKIDVDIFEFFHNNAYAVVGNELFFQAYNPLGYELWKTDGTSEGTMLVKDIHPQGDDNNIGDIVDLNGVAIFTASDGIYKGSELYISDGTAAGTKIVKDINQTGNNASTPQNFFSYNNSLLFSADNGVDGRELWVFDGTSASMIKDISAGHTYSSPSDFVALNGIVYFKASTIEKGRELWKTDGTAAGAVMVKDIYPDAGNALGFGNIVIANNKLYFFANDGATGFELWESDGTEAGTKLVKDINVGEGNSFRDGTLIAYKNEVYFSAHSGDFDYELWKSDGTEAGTILHHHYNFSGSSNPRNFIIFKDYLYYSSKDDLIRTDGTTATKVSDIDPSNLTISGDKLFFVAGFSDGGELWATEGASAYKVKEIRSGNNGSFPSNLTAHKEELYFVANDGNSGNELWKSDGTAAGTILVKDINSGGSSASISQIISFGEAVMFGGGETSSTSELWITDGTETGTKLFQNINPSTAQYNSGSSPNTFFVHNNRLFFSANNGTNGHELFLLEQDALSVDNEDIGKIEKVSIYPNPASENMNLKIDHQQIKSVKIFSLMGKEVMNVVSKDNNIDQIYIGGLSSGMYILQIKSDKNTFVKKIVKQ